MVKVAAGALFLAVVACGGPRLGDDCDPNKVAETCGEGTGFACVENKDGNNRCVSTGFNCRKVCETDDDCKKLFGCEIATCARHVCGGPKTCTALKAGTMEPCPSPY